ncbi:radical SAM protein [Methanobacterium oryzae]|uniref:radical SAM protein n=1 Tax=Methanobacterium oryzae TaxID=69540 RepID=UPI003D22E86B
MIAKRDLKKCKNCNICKNLVACPAGNVKAAIETGQCIGCGVCTVTCPEEALILEESQGKKVNVLVNNQEVEASSTLKNALIAADININKFPVSKEGIGNQIFMPCECGGCWACLVSVNGKIVPSCIMPLKEGMKIETSIDIDKSPILRVVSGFGVHYVGGVGTPYWLKNKGPIEAAVFTHGCNLRCPQCQNFPVAFSAGGNLVDPQEASQILLGLKELHGVSRVVISGGESTLNRRWLIEVIKSVKNQDNAVNVHVDTNGTILTPDYIDELVEAGMTDIGIDLKSMYTSTYMHITGLNDEKLAEKYLETSWNAVEYIINNYLEDIFLGVGIPYNSALISKDEVEEIGKKIFSLKENVQVCVLDYRPEFRRKGLIKPSFNEMLEIKDLLNSTGLETVIIQTEKGHFGP